MSFERDLRWFLDNLDDPPERIHARGVWSDDDGLGSALGTPQWNGAFRAWLAEGEARVFVEPFERQCFHVGAPSPEACMTCASVVTEDGEPRLVPGSGVVRCDRAMYRWPMRAAMAKVRRVPILAGRPDLATTLHVIARQHGDIEVVTSVLARRYPVMGDPVIARGHISLALSRVRRIYSVEALDLRQSRPGERSEAQLNAENDSHRDESGVA